MKNAQQCMEQAGRAGSEEAKAEYLQLAKAWMQLAEELDGMRIDVNVNLPGRPN